MMMLGPPETPYELDDHVISADLHLAVAPRASVELV
jgi:hypothetical protein